jgi:hypothetical protein
MSGGEGWVYVLEADVAISGSQPFRLIKLGRSGRETPHQRINEISREWWQKRSTNVFALHCEAVDDSHAAETALHRQYKPYAQNNTFLRQQLGAECNGDSEWFLVPEHLLGDVVNFADNLGVPACTIPEDALLGMFIVGAACCFWFLFTVITAANNSVGRQQSTILAPGYSAANVRSTPGGTVSGAPLPNGTAVTQTERQGEWCEVTHATGTGWVWCEFVAPN